MAADYYCTMLDVNSLAVQVPFSATSKPSESQVTGYIAQIANDMDVMLQNVGYVVPVVSGPKALAWLRMTCAFGVFGQAQAIRDSGVSTAVSASGREMKNIWMQRYDERMKALTNPQDPTELPDAPRNNEQLEKQPELVVRSFVQGVIDDPDYDPNSPAITRYQTL